MNSDNTEHVFSNYQLSRNSVTFNQVSLVSRIFLSPTIDSDSDSDHLLCRSYGIFLKENCGPGTLTWSFNAEISVIPRSNWAEGHTFLVDVSNSFQGQIGKTLGPSHLGTACAPTFKRGTEIDSRLIVAGGSSIFVPDLKRRAQVGYVQLDFHDVEFAISSYVADLVLKSSALSVDWTPMYFTKIDEAS